MSLSVPSVTGNPSSSRLRWREATAWGLYLLAFSLCMGHQVWLLDAHLTVLKEYKFWRWELGYAHAVPTYIPPVVFLFVFSGAVCCRPPDTSLWPSAGVGLLAAGTTNLLMYPAQVIIYMCHDILLFLEALPTHALCLCWAEPALILQGGARGQVCDCYVPYHGDVRLSTAQGVNITGAALTQIGYETDGDVMVTWVERTNGTWPGDSLNTWDTLSFKTFGGPLLSTPTSLSLFLQLLLLLQSCIIVTICRLPMYLLVQHLAFTDRRRQVAKDIRQRASHLVHRAASPRSVFRSVARLRVEQDRFERQIQRDKKLSIHTVIELCYFNFVEGLDAFTLIEDVVSYGDYFKQYMPLTYAVLTFVSITVFLVTTSNVLALFPEGVDRYSRYTKLFVVILGNLPFLVIRSYLSYLAGGLSNRGLSTIFLMFVVKEVLVLTMGVTEFFLELYASDDTDDKKGRETRAAVRASLNPGYVKQKGLLQMFFQRTDTIIKDNNNIPDDNCEIGRENGVVNTAFEMENTEVQMTVEDVCSISSKLDKSE